MRTTKSHEWIEISDGQGTIGITELAQKEIGDIVFAGLPTVHDKIKEGDVAVIIESEKSAIEIYSPVSGTVTEINEEVQQNPKLISESPEDKGWLFKIKIAPD